MSEMNIYEKMVNINYEFQCKNVKKSGRNKFVGYSYFELSDIVPTINELLLKYKVFLKISYEVDKARMEVINVEKPEEKIEYECPMADVSLKGAHAIQNLGAQQTYIRRYFYMTAFNIVENDYFDAVQGKNEFEASKLRSEIVSLCKRRIECGENKEEIIRNNPEIKVISKMDYSALKGLKERME